MHYCSNYKYLIDTVHGSSGIVVGFITEIFQHVNGLKLVV